MVSLKDHNKRHQVRIMPFKNFLIYLSLFSLMALPFLWSQQRDDTFFVNKFTTNEEYNNPIRQISILGERNSGTRWTYDHISECFNHSLAVENRLTRHKHWFQYNNPSKYLHDTLVLAQFRNPYEWLKAMEHVPHHSPAHLRTASNATLNAKNAANDWKIFLTKPWTTKRVGKDLEMKGDEICQDDFRYKDVVSCAVEPLPLSHYRHTIRYSEHQPFYEMRNDGSGKPYNNILELRSDKIRNFLSVANYPGVADVWVIQYEYLLAKGTAKLLQRIKEWTGVEPRCRTKPPQYRKPRKSRRIPAEFANHVREHLNWTTEAFIGYEIELDRETRQPW